MMAGGVPLAAVDALARAGFRVLPVSGPTRGGKRPLLPAWPERATSDPEEARRLFESVNDACNVGLAMGGEARLIALDLDGVEGAASLDALEAEIGPLPETRTSRTGREGGGEHRIFRVPAGLPMPRNGAGVLVAGVRRPGLDLRSDGGQIVAPPSVHASGRAYEWIGTADVAELPRAWAEALAGAPALAARAAAPLPLRIAPSTGAPWVHRALERACEDVRTAAHGTRNEVLNREAFSLGGFVGAGRLAGELVVRELLVAILANGADDPKAEERKIRDAVASGMHWPRDRDRGEDAQSPVPPSDSDPAHEANQAEGASAVRANPWASRLIDPDPAWFTDAPPPRQWLLRDTRRPGHPGILPLGISGLLIGEGGIGKSYASVSLALAVAAGVPWLGTFTVDAPGPVMLVLGEEDEAETRRRVHDVAQRMGVDAGAIAGRLRLLPLAGLTSPMLRVDGRGNASESDFARWLCAELQAEGEPWSLVVLDPLARFASADAETDNAAATRLVQAFESLVPAAGGATVLVTHHTAKVARGHDAKVTAASARGSSAITDGARWCAALAASPRTFDDPELRERLGAPLSFAVEKSNYAPRGEPLLLRRVHGGALVPLDSTDRDLLRGPQRLDRAELAAARQQRRDADREAQVTAKADALVEAVRSAKAPIRSEAALAALVSGSRDVRQAAVAHVKAQGRLVKSGEGRSAHYIVPPLPGDPSP